MTTAMPDIQTPPEDAALVFASRNGDRDAFGQIVRKYQGMISGLVYSACGDVHRSEDVAQETFISAWKSLSGLREPAKLPAWLCQIARHRIQDIARKSSAEKSAIAGFWSRLRERSATPDQALIKKEEQAVVWRALAEIPQPYRETLVLYYRQGQSTHQVAAAMETSEDAVRQRLARGREMLRGQLGDLIERNLQSSAPNAVFTAAVMSALPAVAPVAATSTGVGTAAKGSLATQHGLLAFLLPWLGALAGLTGGIAGSWAALQGDASRAQRKKTVWFLVMLWLVVALLITASIVVEYQRQQYGWSDLKSISIESAVYAIAWGLISSLVLWQVAQPQAPPDRTRTTAKRATGFQLTIAAGSTLGGLWWLIRLALVAGDWLGASVVAAAIVILATCVFYAIRRNVIWMMLLETIGFSIVIVATLTWRFDQWLATMRGIDPANVNLPLWPVYLAAAIVVTWVGIGTSLAMRGFTQRAINSH